MEATTSDVPRLAPPYRNGGGGPLIAVRNVRVRTAAAEGGDPPDVAGPAPSEGPVEIHPRPKRIALFIDLENAIGHLARVQDTISMERVRATLRRYGELWRAYAFIDASRGSHFDVTDDLARDGVTIIHCPKRPGDGGRLVDTVDEAMKQHIRSFLELRDIDVVAIATNDNGFVDVVQEARGRRREVIVLVSTPAVSIELQRAADVSHDIGSWFARELAACGEQIRSIGVAEPPVFSIVVRDHQDIVRALAEVLRVAARLPSGAPPKFIRDRCWQEREAQLPELATREEVLRCVEVLRELGCLEQRDAADAEGRGAYRLHINRGHPFVRFILGESEPS